jgi:hypothetical protein
MKMPSTFVGRGFSLEEAGQTLSEIRSNLLDSLMVSSKVSKHVKLFLLFVFGDHFMNILILFFSSSNLNEFVVLLDIQQFSLFFRDDLILLYYVFFLQILVDVLTKESIVCKLKMLKTASSFVNSRLHAVKAQTLVLAR